LAVQEVHVQVESGFMDALFASCRDVTVAATGQRAMEMVFGGAGSADAFLAFQGEAAYAAGQSPTRIIFARAPAPAAAGALQAAVVPCDAAGGLGCTCADCTRACGAPPPAPPDVLRWQVPFAAGSVNAMVLLTALALLLALCAAALATTLEDSEGARAPEKPAAAREGAARALAYDEGAGGEAGADADGEEEEAWGGCGAWLAWLGEECAAHPRVVAGAWAGVLLAALAALALTPPHLVTDPVELWARPGSKASLDRAFFDSNFGPSWRTEMLIARPAGGAGGAVTHGALAEVLALQETLEAIEVSCEDARAEDPGVNCSAAGPEDSEVGPWGLDALCFQPTPGAGCIVQSALEFWQLNRSRLDAAPGCDEAAGNTSECDASLRRWVDACAAGGAGIRACTPTHHSSPAGARTHRAG
jgi:hypothetical protein